MDENKKQKIEDLKKQINMAEESLEAAKRALFELTGDDVSSGAQNDYSQGAKVAEEGRVIEGTFNGENMIGPEGKVYPVPANYASKSKLVEGDRLKLTIADDGSFLYKQIEPIKRKKIVGTLKFQDNAYHVLAEGNNYSVLYASVTYHKGKPGDKVTITVPESGNSNWAALEGIIHDVGTNGAEQTGKDATPEPASAPTEPAATFDISGSDSKPNPFEPIAPNLAPASEDDAGSSAVPEASKPEQVPASNEGSVSKLDISDMDISGPASKAPEAVAPEVQAPSQTAPQPQSTTQPQPQHEEPQKPVSEMDI